MSDRYEQVLVTSRANWRRWLREHHDRSPGIWLVTYKKSGGRLHVPYEAIVEDALCFGWIDSRPRSLDDERSQLLLTPRKPTSRWSKANKERVARLTAAGKMTAAGRRAVEVAMANGQWDALDDVEALSEPGDLRAALDAVPAARRHWDGFPPSTRRAILEWVLGAKRAETRARRIETTVTEASAGRRANQWRQPKGTASS